MLFIERWTMPSYLQNIEGYLFRSMPQSFFIDHVALAKQGDNVLGSVRLSICQFVCTLLSEPFTSPKCLSVCL